MIVVKREADTLTVAIFGQFDVRLARAVCGLRRYSPRVWIVELGAAKLIDACGLGLLMMLRAQAHAVDGQIHLLGACGRARETLLAARFDQLFRMGAAVAVAVVTARARVATSPTSP